MLKRASVPYVSDTTKGKSFNFSVWDEYTGYNNNALIQDFVSFDGALYACIKSVLAGDVDPKTDTANGTVTGNYWTLVITGIPGRDGRDGINGKNGVNGRDGRDGTAGQDGLDGMNGRDGKDGKNGTNGKDGLSAYQIAVKRGFKGSEDAWIKSLAKQVGSLPMRNILLRVDTDPALFPDENYCGTHIQWKYDDQDYTEWTNLIQINQLMNLALAGLNLNYNGIKEHDGKQCYNLTLDYNEIDYIDTKNNVKYGPKIRTLSDVYIPISGSGSSTGGDGDGSGDGDKGGTTNNATFDRNAITANPQASCEYYFLILDPGNKGWSLTNVNKWVSVTPGGADMAFDLQEGKDSVLTPCETVTSDTTIEGTGEALVTVCVDENTTGSARKANFVLESNGVTSTLVFTQEK
jgi:hypothetical protein